jgi:hypothetical protein
LPGAPLVVDDDPVVGRIVEAAVVGGAAAAGSAVQEDERLAVAASDLLGYIVCKASSCSRPVRLAASGGYRKASRDSPRVASLPVTILPERGP